MQEISSSTDKSAALHTFMYKIIIDDANWVSGQKGFYLASARRKMHACL